MKFTAALCGGAAELWVRSAKEGFGVAKALEKDPSIPTVLDQLWSRLGPDAFVLADHWEPDLFAVGIASPRNLGVLVYISTYREPAGQFGYELELPPSPGDDSQYLVADRGSGVAFEELARVVAAHLKNAEPL